MVILLTSGLVTALGLPAGGTTAQAASGADAAVTADGEVATSSTMPARVTLTGLSPSVPVAGKTLHVSGTVTNTGKQAVSSAYVVTRIDGNRMGSRGEMSTVLSRRSQAYADGTMLTGQVDQLGSLAPGHSAHFSLSVPVDSLGLGQDGVYEYSVEAHGSTGTAGIRTLGITRTFLPWFPQTTGYKPTKMATLWPLVDQPRRGASTSDDSSQTPIFLNDSLNHELSAGGRLDTLVKLGSTLPVSWTVDPSLVDDATVMAHGYRVERDGGRKKSTKGTGGPAASAWLNALGSATSGRTVLNVPYADPDIASVARQGQDETDALAKLVKGATSRGASVLAKDLPGAASTRAVAWPADGALDGATLKETRTLGDKTLVVDGGSVRLPNDLTYTPNAHHALGKGTQAVVGDATLDKLLTGDLSSPGAATLAVQRYLAETLMITLEKPSEQRGVLVVPPRRMSAATASVLAKGLRTATQAKWLTGSSFSAVASMKQDPAAGNSLDGTAAKAAPRHDLPASYLSTTTTQAYQLQQFSGILSSPSRVTGPFTPALERALSTAWRGSPSGRDAYLGGIRDRLGGLRNAVRLLPKSKVLLSGHSATIGVTVQNQLQQKITGLRVGLSSAQPNRMTAGTTQTVSLDPEHNLTLRFDARATANGPVRMTAQLYTKDGVPYGPPQSFQVNATSLGNNVLLVLGVALLLLVAAVIRMYRKRARIAAARAGSGEDGAGDLPPHGDDDPLPTGAGGSGVDSEVRQPGDR